MNGREDSDQAEQVVLPAGVTMADWFFEQRRWQNPRLRVLLGCVRSLDDVFESNYSILHCSPTRVREIWAQVRQVAGLMRDRLAPLLEGPSRLPELERARVVARAALAATEERTLSELDKFPEVVPEERIDALRRVLCEAMGRMYAFLVDSLGELLAADPRGQHDADYFLAKRFVRDVDEAEWLDTSVSRLDGELRTLRRERLGTLTALADDLRNHGTVPSERRWKEAIPVLDELKDELTLNLRKIIGLRGIRVDELDLLEGYASEIPALCQVLMELQRSGAATLARLESREPAGGESSELESGLQVVHGVFSGRMMQVLTDLDGHLRDLSAFVTLWRRSVSKRRALLLKRKSEGRLC